MQLASFSVSNFRSITTAKKVSLSRYSVLVGANNEGKSNILDALAIGMEAIEAFKYSIQRDRLGRVVQSRRSGSGPRSRYSWKKDFPISKQRSNDISGSTEIILEFELSENEVIEFQEDIGSKLNGTLPVVIRFRRDAREITIAKQGRGGTALTKKANRVAEFVSRRVQFDYIPAIRTSASAENVISDLVAKELSRLEEQPEYNNAIRKIEELQRPILDKLSAAIQETVSSFLPSVKSVNLEISDEARHRAFRRIVDIEVDDGNLTSLERKGDGVKSLVALALMRHASTLAEGKGSTVVAIEEPEAHLHPRAVHELRDVLLSLSHQNQVIITSHSPLFVNPSKLESTIVVQGSKAAPAKNISSVRDILGVRLADNLQSARLVAIVEGSDDILSLAAILSKRHSIIEKAISDGDIVFDDLGGASNLSYKVRTYRSSASLVQCFLDDDKAGKLAVEKAEKDGVIRIADYNLIIVPGLDEAELEDLFDAKVYRHDFLHEFGVDPSTKLPAVKGKKWSDAMKVRFEAAGKVWSKPAQMKAKLWLANFCVDNVEALVLENRSGPIDAFAESLIAKLNSE